MLGTYSLNFIFTVYRVGWAVLGWAGLTGLGWAGLSAEVREGKGRSEGRREHWKHLVIKVWIQHQHTYTK